MSGQSLISLDLKLHILGSCTLMKQLMMFRIKRNWKYLRACYSYWEMLNRGLLLTGNLLKHDVIMMRNLKLCYRCRTAIDTYVPSLIVSSMRSYIFLIKQLAKHLFLSQEWLIKRTVANETFVTNFRFI
jgi:hypothetical protein